MKKTAFILLFFLFQQFIFAQKEQQYYFMKTWNFLKYYHPDLASGKIDADSLFVANIENVSAENDFNDIINQLTKNLNTRFSTAPIVDNQKDILSVNQNFDWFQKNNKITAENKTLLNNIYKNRFDYTLLEKGKSISDEKKYPFPKEENLPLPYRLLTLAKIQGAVDYLFPNKYLMDKNFDTFFTNLLEEATKSPSRKDFEITLAKAVSKMEDSHSFPFVYKLIHLKEIFHIFYSAPFDYQIVGDHLLITHLILPDVCSKAQLNVGDKIIEINGKTIPQIIKEKKELISISNIENLVHHLSEYEYNLIWPNDLKLKNFKVKSKENNKIISTSIEFVDTSEILQTAKISGYLLDKVKAMKEHQLIHNDIAYFKINKTFHYIENLEDDKIDEAMDKMFEEALHKKAIVFDKRGYPDWGGFVFHYIYKYFSPVENYFGKYYQTNLKNIGTFAYQNFDYFPTIENKKTNFYKGKVFILVNSDTQSASEWNTMNLQKIFPQAITIGQRTAGAEGDVRTVNLPGDYELPFSGIGIFYPDNSQTQQTGIRMNELIKYKDQDILENRDLEFERVLELLK